MGIRKFDHGHDIPAQLKGRTKLDRDKLAMVPRLHAVNVAMEALFPIQDWDGGPEEQVAGVAVLFACLCMKTGLDHAELHNIGKRIINAPAEGAHATENSVQVLKDFLGARIMQQEVSVA
jgi:hypothetical protein